MSSLHSPLNQKMTKSGMVTSNLHESPNHLKIAEISEKFKQITYNQDCERKDKINFIENSMILLEKEVTNTSTYETKFRLFRDELNNLQEKQNDERKQREYLEEKFDKDVKNCQDNVHNIIKTSKCIRDEYDEKMNKLTENKTFNLNISHSRALKNLDEESNQKTGELKNFLGDLREGLEAESVQREEGIVLLTEQIEREVKKVSQNLALENRIRDEACKKLTYMIDETYNKLRVSVMNEKKEREENSDMILRLLEDTCNKLDKKVHRY